MTFAYQDNAFSVGPINLTIKRGELLFLIGGNGSGKSTLAMLLTGCTGHKAAKSCWMANPSAANNRKIIANRFRQCLPMSGCLINCWGRRVKTR